MALFHDDGEACHTCVTSSRGYGAVNDTEKC